MLIALGATVVLLVIWLAALRPKPVSVSNTPLAPTTVIPTAKAAAAAADAATAKTQGAVGETPSAAPAATAATPATSAPAAEPAKPAAALSRLDGPVLREIRAGKVVVMLFWNAKGADDIATRGVIRDLDRHDGKVAVHIVPISRVGRYPAITEGAEITQSPTTLVIDRKSRTRVIAGLSEERELSQAVGDALAGR